MVLFPLPMEGHPDMQDVIVSVWCNNKRLIHNLDLANVAVQNVK